MTHVLKRFHVFTCRILGERTATLPQPQLFLFLGFVTVFFRFTRVPVCKGFAPAALASPTQPPDRSCCSPSRVCAAICIPLDLNPPTSPLIRPLHHHPLLPIPPILAPPLPVGAPLHACPCKQGSLRTCIWRLVVHHLLESPSQFFVLTLLQLFLLTMLSIAVRTVPCATGRLAGTATVLIRLPIQRRPSASGNIAGRRT